jgi:hypothetical protein
MTKLFIVFVIFVIFLINSVIAGEQCKQDKQIETNNNETTNLLLIWIILILLFGGIGAGAGVDNGNDRND